jgi:hypothetical protein
MALHLSQLGHRNCVRGVEDKKDTMWSLFGGWSPKSRGIGVTCTRAVSDSLWEVHINPAAWHIVYCLLAIGNLAWPWHNGIHFIVNVLCKVICKAATFRKVKYHSIVWLKTYHIGREGLKLINILYSYPFPITYHHILWRMVLWNPQRIWELERPALMRACFPLWKGHVLPCINACWCCIWILKELFVDPFVHPSTLFETRPGNSRCQLSMHRRTRL